MALNKTFLDEDPKATLGKLQTYLTAMIRGGSALEKAQTMGIVSNASALSSFFEAVIREVNAAKKSRGYKGLDKDFFDATIVNTASTIGEDGKPFRYYAVVDRGRSSYRIRKGQASRIYFKKNTRENPEDEHEVLTQSVKQAAGANITIKSITKAKRLISNQLRKNLHEYFSSQSDEFPDIIPVRGGKYVHSPVASSRGRTRRPGKSKLDPTKVRSKGKRFHSADVEAASQEIRQLRHALGDYNLPEHRVGDHPIGAVRNRTHTYRPPGRPTTKPKNQRDAQGATFSPPLTAIPGTPVDLLDSYIDDTYYKKVDQDTIESVFAVAAAAGFANKAGTFSKEVTDHLVQKAAEIRDHQLKEKKKALQNIDVNSKEAIAVFKYIRKLESAIGGVKLPQTFRKAPNSSKRFESREQHQAVNILRQGSFVPAVIKLKNTDAVVAIFMPTLEAQVKVFQQNTPRRKDFKLLSHNNTYLPVGTAYDELKYSYRIVARKELAKIIRSLK